MTIGLKNAYFAPLATDTEAGTTYGAVTEMSAPIEVSIAPSGGDPNILYAGDDEQDRLYPDPEITVSAEIKDLPLWLQRTVNGRRVVRSGRIADLGSLEVAASPEGGRRAVREIAQEAFREHDDLATRLRGSRGLMGAPSSTDEAYDNYSGKPPMSLMTPEALRAYVEWGFRRTASGDVELRCDPEFESDTFAASWSNGAWELLPDVDVPTVVVSGAVVEAGPSSASSLIAGRLPHAELVVLEHQTHFGPFSHPDEVAALIAG